MDDGSATTDLGGAGLSSVGLTGGAKRTDRGKGIGTKKAGGGMNMGCGTGIVGGGIGGTGSRSTGCGTSRPPPTAAAGKARQTVSSQVCACGKAAGTGCSACISGLVCTGGLACANRLTMWRIGAACLIGCVTRWISVQHSIVMADCLLQGIALEQAEYVMKHGENIDMNHIDNTNVCCGIV